MSQRVDGSFAPKLVVEWTLPQPESRHRGKQAHIILDTGPTKEVLAELAGLGAVSLTLG
jgi:hypothetical protein